MRLLATALAQQSNAFSFPPRPAYARLPACTARAGIAGVSVAKKAKPQDPPCTVGPLPQGRGHLEAPDRLKERDPVLVPRPGVRDHVFGVQRDLTGRARNASHEAARALPSLPACGADGADLRRGERVRILRGSADQPSGVDLARHGRRRRVTAGLHSGGARKRLPEARPSGSSFRVADSTSSVRPATPALTGPGREAEALRPPRRGEGKAQPAARARGRSAR